MTKTRLVVITVLLVAAGLFGWDRLFRVDITNPQPSGANIIAFGDSLTSGVGAKPGEDYPTHLSAIVGRDVLNRGVPGETTAHALRRLDEDVLQSDPRIVIVFLGGNDMLQRLPVRDQFENLDRIIDRIQASGALVALVGLKGLPFDQGYGSEYRDLARRRGCVFIPDGMRGIIDSPRLKSDHVHPNGEGYKVIAARVAEAISPYL